VRHYKVRSLREKIAIVLQEPVLFAGTIRDNLRYGRLDATDEEVEAPRKPRTRTNSSPGCRSSTTRESPRRAAACPAASASG